MACTIYVVRRQGQWQIKHGNQQEGGYITRGGAVRAAIAAAYKASREGSGAQVLSQGYNKWHTEWAC